MLEVFTEDPRPEDPGPNLLLRVPGLFNIVCNTRVDRRTPHLPVISVSWHFMCVLYLATCKIKLKMNGNELSQCCL